MVYGLIALVSALVGAWIAYLLAQKIFDFLTDKRRPWLVRISLLASIGFVIYFTVNQDVIFTNISYFILGFLLSGIYHSALIYSKIAEVLEKIDTLEDIGKDIDG